MRSLALANQISQQFGCDCFTVDGDSVLASGVVNAGHHVQQRMQILQEVSEKNSALAGVQEELARLDADLEQE